MHKALCLILLAVSLSQAGEPLTAAPPPAITLKSPGVKTVISAPPFAVGSFQIFAIENYSGSVTWEVEGDCIKLHELTKAATRIEWPDGNGDPVLTDIATGTLLIRGQKAGTAKLSAWGVVDGKAKKLASRTIEVGGGAPDPFPKPDPKPEPYTGKLRLLVIEETEEAANNRGQYFTDETLAAYLKAKCSHRPRVADQNVKDATGNPPADIAPWLALAKGKKLPQWYVIKPTGEILISGDMPGTPADMLKKLKEIAGE